MQVFSIEVERLVVAQTNRMFLNSMPWLPSLVLDGRSVQHVMPLDTDDGYGSAGAAAAPLPHLSKQAFCWARRSPIYLASRMLVIGSHLQHYSFLDPNYVDLLVLSWSKQQVQTALTIALDYKYCD